MSKMRKRFVDMGLANDVLGPFLILRTNSVSVCVLREKEAEDCIQGSSDVLLPSTGERPKYVCGVYMVGLEVRVGAWEDRGRERVKAERLKLICLRLEVKLPYDLLPAYDQAPA